LQQSPVKIIVSALTKTTKSAFCWLVHEGVVVFEMPKPFLEDLEVLWKLKAFFEEVRYDRLINLIE
jgi:hypothetical protein